MGKGFDLQSFISNNPANQTAELARAYEVHSTIISGAQTAQQGLYQMAEGFKTMRDEKLYKAMGYDSFADYCEKETGINRSQVYRYIGILEKLPNDLSTRVDKIGERKLTLLTSLTDDQRDEITETVDLETTTVKELRERIKELTADKEETETRLKAQIEDMEKAPVDVTKSDDYIRLKKEREDSKAQIEEITKSEEEKRFSLETKIEGLQQQLEDLESTQDDVTQSDEYVELSKELDKLTEERDNRNRYAEELEKENIELSDKIEELSKQIKELENRPVDVAVQDNDDREEINRLSGELKDVQKKLANAEEKLKRNNSTKYKDFLVRMSIEEYNEFLDVLTNNPKLSKTNFHAIMQSAKMI